MHGMNSMHGSYGMKSYNRAERISMKMMKGYGEEYHVDAGKRYGAGEEYGVYPDDLKKNVSKNKLMKYKGQGTGSMYKNY